MQHKTGLNRYQISMMSMDEMIATDNPVRLIDRIVEEIDIKTLKFKHTEVKKEGTPPFHPRDLLKLYLYGYLNRVRSSRRLEKECVRNIEVRWLIKGLVPNYHTIADFRKDHPEQLKQVFKIWVKFLKSCGLIDAQLVAIDSSKFRAVNSKKNNYNQKKIDRHVAYIENKTEEYLQELDKCDAEEEKTEAITLEKEKIREGLKQLEERRKKYALLQQAVNESKDGQVSTTDPESRALIINKNIVEVAYNVQTATEAKNKLIVHFDTTNENDSKALAPIAKETKEVLGSKELTTLADKGYHNGEQLAQCEKEDITTLVAYREQPTVKHLEREYLVANFTYNKEEDTYTCPQGHKMQSNGNWYTKTHSSEKRKTGSKTKVKHYKTKRCKNCPILKQCTKNTRGRGRVIERGEHQDVIDRNNHRIDTQKELYRTRQAICEHPYGTIKRAWGYSYTLLKGKKKVNGEMSLILLMYNIRRTMSILGLDGIYKHLDNNKVKNHLVFFVQKWLLELRYGRMFLENWHISLTKNCPLKTSYTVFTEVKIGVFLGEG